MSHSEFNQQLCQFLNQSPTPFHAVASMKSQLEQAGFQSLNEMDSWGELEKGRYYVTRNDSSLIAFNLPAASSELPELGFHMLGAHTDSPCLKVKPQPEKERHGLWQLGVEVYGGALLNPWFDRDLSMAGRVSYLSPEGQIEQCLVNFEKAVATIPNLAIHLDREANKNRTVNPQLHLPPVLMQTTGQENTDFRALLHQQISEQYPDLKVDKVLDYEICFYDTQTANVIGLNEDFIASARLDNLLSCFIGLDALINADASQASMIVCSDHEEVGSASTSGADGTFLESVLRRLANDEEGCQRMLQRSMLISADNAHAIHPNYSDKHDAEHGPILNQGPVIKTNANQRYATNSETSAYFRLLCEKADVPVQDFVVRTDMGCGSTIGPITASRLGVKTIDVGVPTYAMHSIRELAGSKDSYMLRNVIKEFFEK